MCSTIFTLEDMLIQYHKRSWYHSNHLRLHKKKNRIFNQDKGMYNSLVYLVSLCHHFHTYKIHFVLKRLKIKSKKSLFFLLSNFLPIISYACIFKVARFAYAKTQIKKHFFIRFYNVWLVQ